MFCENCGTEIKENSNFCLNCGKAVSITANEHKKDNYRTQDVSSNEKMVNLKKPRIATWILIGFGGFSMLMGFLGLVLSYDTATSVGNIIVGLPLCIFGAILYVKKIKKYGWGIGVAVLVAGIGNSLVDIFVGGRPFSYHKSGIIGSFVLIIVFSCLLLKANIKNKGAETNA